MPSFKLLVAVAAIAGFLAFQPAPAQAATHRTAVAASHHRGHSMAKKHKAKHRHKHHKKHHKTA